MVLGGGLMRICLTRTRLGAAWRVRGRVRVLYFPWFCSYVYSVCLVLCSACGLGSCVFKFY